jgi:hypothetical protein
LHLGTPHIAVSLIWGAVLFDEFINLGGGPSLAHRRSLTILTGV